MATYAFAAGITGTPGYGQNYQIEFSGNSSGTGAQWTEGDTWTLSLVTPAGNIVLGAGNVAGIVPFCGFASHQRMFIGAVIQSQIRPRLGANFLFSALDDPTGWNEQDVGSGSISFESQFGMIDTVNAFALYQGRLAVFGLYSIQIWTTDADPNNFVRNQILTNIGTDASLSVVGFGELDVFFRASSGIRSLRVRDASLNAYVTDIGSPIDSLLQVNTSAHRAASCAELEPTEHRLWHYENGVIYVLSYFPTLKISAWSTYLPTYDVTTTISPTSPTYGGPGTNTFTGLVAGATYVWTPGVNEVSLTADGVVYTAAAVFVAISDTVQLIGGPSTAYTGSLVQHVQTTFTPEKFIVYQGQMWVRSTTGDLFQFGGTDNQTYDYCIATVETPWLDVRNKISTRKQSTSVDMIAVGSWDLYAGMDYRGGTTRRVKVADSISSPDQGVITFSAEGTHVKMKAVSSGLTKAGDILSALVWHYNDSGEKR